MPNQWQPFHEPLRTTLLRTCTIALIAGAAFSLPRGGLAAWPRATLLMLWPAFGGHWIELFFLNVLRPRLPSSRPAQIAARLAVWFLGGALLTLGMALTATALVILKLTQNPPYLPPWYLGGLAFIAVELIVHLIMQLFRLPNFYNGRA